MLGNTVLPFLLRTKASYRLTQQDKVDAWLWEQTALDRGYDRAVVQADALVQDVKQDEFVLIYRLGHPWARWGAARRGSEVMVWRCSDGAEVGLYICMKSALSEIPHASSAYDTQSFNTLGTGVVIKIQSVSECTIIE